MKQLESGFERKINWNKYQTKVLIEEQNEYLYYLIEPSFQAVNRLSILSFEENAHQTRRTRYFLPKVEIKYYNVKIDG